MARTSRTGTKQGVTIQNAPMIDSDNICAYCISICGVEHGMKLHLAQVVSSACEREDHSSLMLDFLSEHVYRRPHMVLVICF